DAERLAAALDVTHRLARGRATGIATMPILRAAIETDAATVQDIADRDGVFSVGPDETLEGFQLRPDGRGDGSDRSADQSTEMPSLLPLPAEAPALTPLGSRPARITTTKGAVILVASVPIERATPGPGPRIAGEVAVATRVELSAAIDLLT